MIAFAPDFSPGSDAGLSSEAEFLHELRYRHVASSPSVDASRRLETLQQVQDAAQSSAYDDWDGEGASAVEQSTVRYAAKFVWALPQGVTSPDVLVDRDGDLVFDWGTTARRTFSVSVGRDGTLSYAGVFDQAHTHGKELFTGAIPATILLSIDRVSR